MVDFCRLDHIMQTYDLVQTSKLLHNMMLWLVAAALITSDVVTPSNKQIYN